MIIENFSGTMRKFRRLSACCPPPRLRMSRVRGDGNTQDLARTYRGHTVCMLHEKAPVGCAVAICPIHSLVGETIFKCVGSLTRGENQAQGQV